MRLFRKDKARWEGDYVHESLVIDGRIEKLKGAIHHFTYDSIAEHVACINKFSDLGAQKLYARKKGAGSSTFSAGRPAGSSSLMS